MNRFDHDILASNLDAIFCGLNPAQSAADDGYNFSNRSNRFWPVLHAAGFTDTRLEPKNERRLLKYRCGITAIVSRPTRRAEEIEDSEFRTARPGFEAKIRRYAPRAVAFLGKRGYGAMCGQVNVPWGLQPDAFGGAMIWVLPNPSGLNRGFSLDSLTVAYRELRNALSTTS
jgi:TDG/mug DNA glycosylase family protein